MCLKSKYFPLKRLHQGFTTIYETQKRQKSSNVRPFGLFIAYFTSYIVLFDLYNFIHFPFMISFFGIGVLSKMKQNELNQKVVNKIQLANTQEGVIWRFQLYNLSQKSKNSFISNKLVKVQDNGLDFQIELQQISLKNAYFLFYQNEEAIDNSPEAIKKAQIEDDQLSQKDILVLDIENDKQDQDLIIQIFDNEVKEYNEYLIALGQNKEIVFKN